MGTLLLSYHKRHSFEDTTSSLRPMATHILSSVNPHGFVNIIIPFLCNDMYFNIDGYLTDFLTVFFLIPNLTPSTKSH